MTKQPNFPSEKVVIDRVTNRISSSSVWHSFLVRLTVIIHRRYRTLGYIGISRILGALGKLHSKKFVSTVIDAQYIFSFPSGDYYWSRLYDRDYFYEPEIASVLSLLSEYKWVFIDCGANFGYWSTRVASGEFGQRSIIAIEPNSDCEPFLIMNLRQYSAKAEVLTYAVWSESDLDVYLQPGRHAGRSARSRVEAAHQIPDTHAMKTISLDDLYVRKGLANDTLAVAKIDIEGAEEEAILGAREYLDNLLFIVEDVEPGNRLSSAIQRAFGELSMSFFYYRDGKILPLLTLTEIIQHKRELSMRWQMRGINLLATRSMLWKKYLSTK